MYIATCWIIKLWWGMLETFIMLTNGFEQTAWLGERYSRNHGVLDLGMTEWLSDIVTCWNALTGWVRLWHVGMPWLAEWDCDMLECLDWLSEIVTCWNALTGWVRLWHVGMPWLAEWDCDMLECLDWCNCPLACTVPCHCQKWCSFHQFIHAYNTEEECISVNSKEGYQQQKAKEKWSQKTKMDN